MKPFEAWRDNSHRAEGGAGPTSIEKLLAAGMANAITLANAVRTFGAFCADWLDLAIRFWLAQAFLTRAAMSMAMHSPPTMTGEGEWARGFDQLIASPLGAVVQTAAPLLLLIGLMTRLAAFSLLIEAAFLNVMQANNALHLFWAALLGWLFVIGAGPYSIDAALAGGLDSSAIPGATRLRDLCLRFTHSFGAFYHALLRVWIATAPLGAAAAAFVGLRSDTPDVLMDWFAAFPGQTASFPAALLLVLGALIAVGLFARVCAAILFLAIPVASINMTLDDRLYWALLLALLALHGSGRWSLDAMLTKALTRWELRLQRPPADLPHVVIVGGGFGGVSAARGLKNAPCNITLIDQRNHNLFQPLLYQVATAGLSPADIATPIRSLFRTQDNLRVRLATVCGVSAATNEVECDTGSVGFDYLVLATGARHSYFGHEDWADGAPGLKTVEDATSIRRRLLVAFERAEEVEAAAERAAFLTFIIVGGGPTGVELAGAIAELARTGLKREFRNFDPAQARVILVQSAQRLLPTFPESLSRNAAIELTWLGVEVRTGSRVEHVDEAGAVVDGARVEARTVIWAAGVAASAAGEWLGAPVDKSGRVIVQPDLSIAPYPAIFAIGDTAFSTGWRGQPVPGLAPAAVQGGRYVAKLIAGRLRGRPDLKPFRYRHLGSLATVGRRVAVADFGAIRLQGALAWWVWGAVHILFLAGGRNRLAVAINWMWAYLTGRRGSRLIVERPTA